MALKTGGPHLNIDARYPLHSRQPELLGRLIMIKKTLAREYPPAGEAACTRDLAQRLLNKIVTDNPSGIMRRDAHPKMHGVVKAEFSVDPGLPPHLRVGVFKEAKTYQAWIRFSNQDGTIGPDSGRDIRGMAVKIMGVPGEKLLELERHEPTQDFVFISTSVFVTANVAQFDKMITAFTGSTWAKVVFMLGHPRVVWNLARSMKRFANPLQIRYFSSTPYLFGTHAVKYAVTPRVKHADVIPSAPDPDYLRLAMVNQLRKGDALFDFSVQLQVDAERMPIEDPGKRWSETLSPFCKLATIRILRQEFDSVEQRTFGENLSFSPWHSLPEHRPLGGINRARKVVYAVISSFRHERNKVARLEPSSWD
jgi:hypothetical protein